jgi:HEAT repeat protein
MREDFALELNAFKPSLPTLLFGNYYRLEKLDEQNAKLAIVRPVELIGFQYEPELVTALLTDLAVREERGSRTGPVGEVQNAVEPAYLQIICSQLWSLEQKNPSKSFRFDTYKTHGRAQGLLRSYVENRLNSLSLSDKKLASLALDHLISRRGTKVAYTVEALAGTLEVDPQELRQVLERLYDARILRRQQRQEVLWYELYHDLWSQPLETWNTAYKTAQRNRRAMVRAGMVVLSVFVLFAVYNVIVNWTNYHFRLSVKEGISDTVELYRGKAGARDLFGLQHYLGEANSQRTDIEPDKRFAVRAVGEFDRHNLELMGNLPLVERLDTYWQNGAFAEAEKLAKVSIADDNPERSQKVIGVVANAKTIEGLHILQERLGKLSNVELKRQLVKALGTIRVVESVKILDTVQDQDSTVRWAVAGALGQLGDARAVEPLIARLGDTDSDVRRAVAEALGQLTARDAQEFLLRILQNQKEEQSVRMAAAAALLASGEARGRSFLEKAGKSEDDNDRKALAILLGQVPSTDGNKFLVELLADSSHDVRVAAIDALGRGKTKEDTTHLVPFLQDADRRSQSAAVNAIATLASPDSIPVLRSVINNAQLALPHRLTALKGLRNIGSEKAVEALIEVAGQDNLSLRLRAYQLLGSLKAPQALPSLVERLVEHKQLVDTWRIQRDATDDETTLSDADKPQLQPTAIPRRASYWEFLLAYAIARIDPQREGIKLLSHDLAEVRHGAWIGLGSVGTVALVKMLDEQRTKSDDPFFRQAAYRAIGECLTWIEARGGEQEQTELEAWLPSLQQKPDVYGRVQWTTLRLQWGKHEPTGTSSGKGT